jgi:hypothetical protein
MFGCPSPFMGEGAGGEGKKKGILVIARLCHAPGTPAGRCMQCPASDISPMQGGREPYTPSLRLSSSNSASTPLSASSLRN